MTVRQIPSVLGDKNHAFPKQTFTVRGLIVDDTTDYKICLLFLFLLNEYSYG